MKQTWLVGLAAFALGASAGVYIQQTMTTRTMASTYALFLAGDLIDQTALLEALNRKDPECARAVLLIQLKSSLKISVPDALGNRPNDKSREHLQKFAQKAQAAVDIAEAAGPHGCGPNQP